MTHTPGPWRVGTYGTTVMTGRPLVQANDTICSLYTPIHSGVGLLVLQPDVRIEQFDANARLIAAAPDLLQAAKCALADLEGLIADADIDPTGDEPAALTIRELKAAIAKAEGADEVAP